MSITRRSFVQNSSLLALGLLTPITSFAGSRRLDLIRERPLKKIAFGSCNRSYLAQDYWPIIGAENPDLWLWLGDNIYADLLTMDQRVKTYQSLYHNPYYADFRSSVPIIGMWDDHDFAYNNCDGSFHDKEASREAALNFLDIAGDDPVWQRDGIYQSYTFGPRGKKTQVLLPDLRYNMDKARAEWRLLGDRQWAWFEDEMRSSDADLIIIGSSLNVTSDITGFGIEGWHSYGWERQRLYDLITEVAKPTLILSGDRHFAEMYELMLPSGQKIYEVMSSGMTHSLGLHLPHKGRIGKMVGGKNYGLIEIDWTSVGPVVKASHRSTVSKEVYQDFQLFTEESAKSSPL